MSEGMEYVFDGVEKGVKDLFGRREEGMDLFLVEWEVLVWVVLGWSLNVVIIVVRLKGKKDVCFLGEEGWCGLRRGGMVVKDDCGCFDFSFWKIDCGLIFEFFRLGRCDWEVVWCVWFLRGVGSVLRDGSWSRVIGEGVVFCFVRLGLFVVVVLNEYGMLWVYWE